MWQQIISMAYDLKERQLYPLFKKILNIIFVAGLSSYLFTKSYFQYELLDPLDYNGIYFFFIKGTFLVPFGIFFIIWHSTDLLSTLLFKLPNLIIGNKLRNAIIQFSLAKTFGTQQVGKTELVVIGNNETRHNDGLLPLLEIIQNKISAVDFVRLKKRIEKVQATLTQEFTVVVRGLLATTIFFLNVEHFGWLLLTLLYVTAISIGLLLFVSYQLAEIFPLVLHKAVDLIKEYKNKVYEPDGVTTITIHESNL